jgi:hypothetical protein
LFAQNKPSILETPNNLKKFLSQNNVWGAKLFIGYSKEKRPVYAYYYNKGGRDKAMVIGGVHGSEFYGVDVALALKDCLDKMKVQKFKWKILIIPEIFPDNVKKGREHIFEINYGRRTCEICHGQVTTPPCKLCVDPIRQMPRRNELFKPGDSLSGLNEKIEVENQYLLFITQVYNPIRIASLHCKNSSRDNEIGIYADPRTNSNNIALGFSDDAVLAIRMAFIVKENGGIIYGNFADSIWSASGREDALKIVSYLNAVYPQDPPAANKGNEQERSYKTNDGKVTFGTWASTEIKINSKIVKNAATTLTIELPQYYSFFREKYHSDSLDREKLKTNTIAYIKALKEIFLENK